MNKVEQLEKLQARKVELLTIMAKSDKHALKCYKLGKKFQTQYPEEYAEYVAANEEYQQVERDINNLEFELSLEENGTESEGTAPPPRPRNLRVTNLKRSPQVMNPCPKRTPRARSLRAKNPKSRRLP